VLLPPRVDIDTAAGVEVVLREAISGGGVVDWDCADVRFVDSAGAKMLFKTADLATARHCVVRIAGLRGGPMRVLTLLGIFDVCQRVEE
jgi:anti-anti-sigma regulatory factor